jgi:hypothetical protein
MAFLRAYHDATIGRCLFESVPRPLCERAGNAVAGGRLRFDASRAGACLEAARKAPCDSVAQHFYTTLEMTPDLMAFVPGCEGVLAGVRKAGEGCREVREKSLFIGECAGGLFCDTSQRTGCEGTCAPLLGEGEACKESHRGQCAPGLGCRKGKCAPLRKRHGEACAADDACLGKCVDGKCVAYGLLGGPCNASQFGMACVRELTCDRAVRRCVARREAGAGCEADDECAAGLACVEKRCAPRGEAGAACAGAAGCLESLRCLGGRCVAPSANGGPCVEARDCVDVQADCRVLAPGQSATCHVGPAPVGASCRAAAECAAPATCRADPTGGKRCAPKLALGKACAEPTDCESKLCRDGKCVAPAAIGGACATHLDCRSGLACLDQRCANPLAAGAACENYLQCAPELFCYASKVCAPRAVLGAACEPVGCAEGLTCIDAKCVLTPCKE